MKYLFLGIFALLLIASGVTALMMPEQQTEKPIIYWVTDANPARTQQIKLFEQWMVENGHTAPDGTSKVQLLLDTANNDPSKKIIQAVSGVAGDVMDIYSGGDMHYFRSMGVLEDITDDALAMGFDPSHTYASAYDELTIDGRQYSFPCNLSAHGMWVNKDVFEKVGMSPPAWRWSMDDFERIGKELCYKANAGRTRREVFLAGYVDPTTLHRSMGLDRFNETMTACTLDDPRYVELLKRMHKWTFVDNILPKPEDSDALAAQQAGYGGNQLSWFNRGNVALLYSGRYALIQFREFNASRIKRGDKPLNLGVVEHPNGGFANSTMGARAAVVYAGSQHKEYAKFFLSFLASRQYNMQIVDDADSLPPSPAYARTEEFLRPAKFPEEHGVHEPWARLADEIAIVGSFSPFVLDRVATRIYSDQSGSYMAGQTTAEQAARRTAQQINAEIQRRLEEDKSLKPIYQKRLADQKRIEELRAKGEPVPLELITNPFHRRYYVEMGWSK